MKKEDKKSPNLHIYTFYFGFKSSPNSKILVMCETHAKASNLAIYNIFVPQKVSLLKIPDDVISRYLWFPPIKNPGYAYDKYCVLHELF